MPGIPGSGATRYLSRLFFGFCPLSCFGGLAEDLVFVATLGGRFGPFLNFSQHLQKQMQKNDKLCKIDRHVHRYICQVVYLLLIIFF